MGGGDSSVSEMLAKHNIKNSHQSLGSTLKKLVRVVHTYNVRSEKAGKDRWSPGAHWPTTLVDLNSKLQAR